MTHQDTFLNTVEPYNSKNFYPESVALFLDDESFYHTATPLSSILICSETAIKAKNTAHVTLTRRYGNQILNNKDWILKRYLIRLVVLIKATYISTWPGCCQHIKQCCHWSILHMPTMPYRGGELGIFWKVAESLQKCRPPWLADEEHFGLRNG